MKYSEAGKGSKSRKNADHEKYSDGYDRIFGKSNIKQKRVLEEMVRVSEEMGLYDLPLQHDMEEPDSRDSSS